MAQQSPSLSVGRESRVVLVGSGSVLLRLTTKGQIRRNRVVLVGSGSVLLRLICPFVVRNRVGSQNASRTCQSKNHRRREQIPLGIRSASPESRIVIRLPQLGPDSDHEG